jgi:polyhydroxybutyrate depolymerase
MTRRGRARAPEPGRREPRPDRTVCVRHVPRKDRFGFGPAAEPGIKVVVRKRPGCRATATVALALLLPVFLLISACAEPAPRAAEMPPQPQSPLTRIVSFPSPVGKRWAIVHHPRTAGRNSPLVVVINGAYGSAQGAMASFNWNALADQAGLVVAYPNASGPLWNAGDCCGAAHANHVDDVGFLHQLSQFLQRQDGVDPRRVYAVGISNGAMMAYGWACGRPGDLAGIGAVAGALVSPCTPTPTLTVVAIHGTADRNVPIGGGVGPLSVTKYPYPSLTTTLAPFVSADGCDPTPRQTHKPLVQISTWNCDGGRNVVMAVVTGMGHIWPGARPTRPRARTAHPVPIALDATTFLWSGLRSSRLSRDPG